MIRVAILIGVAGLWAGLIWGALELSKMPLAEIRSLCGPWGCLPPTSALVSIHALWAAILIPLAVVSFWGIPRIRSPRIWRWAMVGSVLLIVGFLGYRIVDAAMHLAIQPRDGFRFVGYTLLTASDFPILQLAFATGLNWFLSFRLTSGQSATPDHLSETGIQEKASVSDF